MTVYHQPSNVIRQRRGCNACCCPCHSNSARTVTSQQASGATEAIEEPKLEALISERLLDSAAIRHFILSSEEEEWPDILQQIALLGIQAIKLQYGRTVRLVDLAVLRTLCKYLERNGTWPSKLEDVLRTVTPPPTSRNQTPITARAALKMTPRAAARRCRTQSPLLSSRRAITSDGESSHSSHRGVLLDGSEQGLPSKGHLTLPGRVRPSTKLRCRSAPASPRIAPLTAAPTSPATLLGQVKPLQELRRDEDPHQQRQTSSERRMKLRETQDALAGSESQVHSDAASEEWYSTLMSRLQRLGTRSNVPMMPPASVSRSSRGAPTPMAATTAAAATPMATTASTAATAITATTATTATAPSPMTVPMATVPLPMTVPLAPSPMTVPMGGTAPFIASNPLAAPPVTTALMATAPMATAPTFSTMPPATSTSMAAPTAAAAAAVPSATCGVAGGLADLSFGLGQPSPVPTYNFSSIPAMTELAERERERERERGGIQGVRPGSRQALDSKLQELGFQRSRQRRINLFGDDWTGAGNEGELPLRSARRDEHAFAFSGRRDQDLLF